MRLEDASGFNTNAFQADLEAAAQALQDSFPAEFQDDFKVYDFGFYLHQEVTDGGYPAAFSQKVAAIAQMSPYYLVFGKQTDRTGIYSKFWVALKLPTTGKFSCLSELQRIAIIHRIEKAVSIYYLDKKGDIFEYSNSEISGLNQLKSEIFDIIQCCPIGSRYSVCSSCEDKDISAVLDEKGFSSYNILIEQPVFGQNFIFENSNVKDISNIRVDISTGTKLLLGQHLNGLITKIKQYVDIGLLVTSNSNFCPNSLSELEALNSHRYNVWLNLSPDESLKLKLNLFSNLNSRYERGIQAAIVIFVSNFLNLEQIFFESGNSLDDEVDDFFEYFQDPDNIITPQKIADDLWNYQPKIKMDEAPESSPKNSLGVNRNGKWFFKQLLKNWPEAFDASNRVNIENGIAPVVNDTWIAKNPNHLPFKGDFMDHHHVNHDVECVAIPRTAHSKFSRWIHFLTKKEKSLTPDQKRASIQTKINEMNRSLGKANLFLNFGSIVEGVYSKDPDNPINWNPQGLWIKMNQLYKLVPENVYVMFDRESIWVNVPTDGPHKGWERMAYYKGYALSAWDDDEKRYVGLGLAIEGYTVTLSSGKQEVYITGCYLSDNPVCNEDTYRWH